jgi:protein-S-isoprenylcysteine O-methyltransferase Ste14
MEKQNMWLQVVRYYTAILILFGVPVGLLMWLVIHPFHKLLRQIGLGWAYLIVAIPLTLLAGMILWFRDVILATDYGMNYFLMVLSVAPFALAVAIYLSHRKYLTLPIQVGVPELTGGQKGVLLTEGIYSRIRHPRYVESVLWILGYALFTNYLALYLVFLLMLPVMHLIVLLEEKELKERFGRDYEEYCHRVPRYIPKITWGSQKAA